MYRSLEQVSGKYELGETGKKSEFSLRLAIGSQRASGQTKTKGEDKITGDCWNCFH